MTGLLAHSLRSVTGVMTSFPTRVDFSVSTSRTGNFPHSGLWVGGCPLRTGASLPTSSSVVPGALAVSVSVLLQAARSHMRPCQRWAWWTGWWELGGPVPAVSPHTWDHGFLLLLLWPVLLGQVHPSTRPADVCTGCLCVMSCGSLCSRVCVLHRVDVCVFWVFVLHVHFVDTSVSHDQRK